MNLGKLLGAGKSFFGGGRAVKYRAGKGGLPKFNAGKNPFTSKPSEPAAPVVAPETQKVSATSVAAPKPVRAAGWAGKLNPFRAPEPVAPMPNVQPELLSIDAVKVLHNDLSDADVEVVPVRSRTVTPVSTVGIFNEQIA
jgi:hypothetical protein